MTFSESVKTVLHDKYATFNGRASHSEYWWFFLFNSVISVPLLVLGMIIGAVFGFSASGICGSGMSECGLVGLGTGVGIGYVLVLLYGLAVIVPGIAVAVRRLHDTGRSGWWYLISLVPSVGDIVLLVFMLLASTPGDNVYGPNPCDAPEGE